MYPCNLPHLGLNLSMHQSPPRARCIHAPIPTSGSTPASVMCLNVCLNTPRVKLLRGKGGEDPRESLHTRPGGQAPGCNNTHLLTPRKVLTLASLLTRTRSPSPPPAAAPLLPPSFPSPVDQDEVRHPCGGLLQVVQWGAVQTLQVRGGEGGGEDLVEGARSSLCWTPPGGPVGRGTDAAGQGGGGREGQSVWGRTAKRGTVQTLHKVWARQLAHRPCVPVPNARVTSHQTLTPTTPHNTIIHPRTMHTP